MAPQNNFWTYVKAAFGWHWNLLAVGVGVAFSILSGRPDVILPLVAAGEVAYLGLLATHPRFRKSVDARGLTAETQVQTDLELKRLVSALSPRDLKRFQALRDRCLMLQKLSRQLHGQTSDDTTPISDLHAESLDRLLWMFLKLLASQDALDRFLKNTDRSGLLREINATQATLDKARAEGRKDTLIRSLEDKVATMQARLKNYDAALENSELLKAELERIEQKVTAVSELSLSQADSSLLSAEVDGITESLSVTAEAIRTLDLGPQLTLGEKAPKLLMEKN